MPYKDPEAAKARNRRYYADHRSQRLANQKRYDDAHPDKKREGALRRLYGLTQEQYDQKLDEQTGVCAICDKTCLTGRALAVDHSHASKRVRGLLCNKCNNLLGRAEDSVARLERAIAYLKKYQE